MRRIRTITLIPLLSGLVYLSLAPVLGTGTVSFHFQLLKYLVLSQSMNLIAGYTGYVDFGHVVWFGLGTYVAAILIHTGIGLQSIPVIPAILGGFFAASVAAAVGLPLLRLKGPYFSISMLVFNESARVIITLTEPITGGVRGIPEPRIYNPLASYYYMLGLAIIFMLGMRYLAASRFGVALRAIREDEEAASAMGINTTIYKVTAFSASAFFAGVAGGIDFWFVTYTAPELVFNVVATIEMIVMMMFGGAGTVLGPVIGATSLYIIRDYFWVRFPFIYFMLFGSLVVILVIFMPRGVLGLIESKVPSLRAKVR